jgi:hypothetical protein
MAAGDELMPRALLTNREWHYPDSDYADDPHWEERLFGDRHPFTISYHNNIRYGLGEWGPIGWIRVFLHRAQDPSFTGKCYGRRGPRWGWPRCATCGRIMWPWLVGYESHGNVNCGRCEFPEVA